jgi:hypothetical protein
MYDLVPQTQLRDEIRTLMRDATGARWSDQEIYSALNMALYRWRDKVSIPQLYALEFSDATYTYALPRWISPPFRVILEDDQVYDATNYTVLPGATGWTLQFLQVPPDGDGYVVWNLRNGQLPTALPELGEALTDVETDADLDDTYDLPQTAYIRIGSETMLYTGIDGVTLEELTRGVLSTAAAHDSADTVEWCAAIPNAALRTVLLDETRMRLHEMYLSNGSPKERDFHMQMISYYQANVDKFWTEYHDTTYTARMKPQIITSGWIA